jgi:hypothetical protein
MTALAYCYVRFSSFGSTVPNVTTRFDVPSAVG